MIWNVTLCIRFVGISWIGRGTFWKILLLKLSKSRFVMDIVYLFIENGIPMEKVWIQI